jgi:hypothetical protein
MFIKNRSGSGEALGFAAVALIMFVVIFNLLPPMLALQDYWLLTQVQRDALLKMELNGGMTPAIHDEVNDKLEEHGFNLSNIDIQATPAPVDYGNDVEIQISYDYTYDLYTFSSFSILKTDEPRTMTTSGRSVSFYFEK